MSEVTAWASKIAAAWRSSVAGIIETGRILTEAKAALVHGDFQAMIERDLPFKARTAQMLMAIARDERLANPNLGSHLPPSWRTLHELTKLPDAKLEAKIADGTIRPDMERREIVQEVKAERRAVREVALAQQQAALPEKRYGVILADPEWRFEPYSRETGMDRAADNHYPTSLTEAIASRDVAAIAAEDCVLFLWATVPMLPAALWVMTSWGFAYRSNFVWVKDRIGTGYWNRNQHEHLLIGVRGNIPAPTMGTQWTSTIAAAVTIHSAKPERFFDLIETYFPTLPKIELNRRGPARVGWDAWGNESGSTIISRDTDHPAVASSR